MERDEYITYMNIMLQGEDSCKMLAYDPTMKYQCKSMSWSINLNEIES